MLGAAIPGNVPVSGDVLLIERSVIEMKKMRIGILSAVLLLLLILAPTPALAEVTTTTDYQQVGEQWMDQRMGTAAADAMEARMAAVMGDQYVRQMQETMGRMIVDDRGAAGFSMPIFGGKGASTMMGFGWGWGHGMGWGWMVIGGALLLFLLVWAIIMLVRRREHGSMGPMPMCMRMGGMGQPYGDAGDRPLQILKERYAKGEITKEQFDQMKRDLLA